MREVHGLNQSRVAFRHRASAWLTLASLLALSLSQAFHAPPPAANGERSLVAAEASLLASRGTPQHAPHDADACPVCRATAQTRLGLRAPIHANALAIHAADLPLHVPLAGPAKPAPELAAAHPRAPPTTPPALDA